MKKFINGKENITKETLEGFVESAKDLVELLPNNLVVNKNLAVADRVTIVSQGGSGHEPALYGFVGDGMQDICVVGDVFAAPGPQACVEAIKKAENGKGVLYIVFNHAGDMLTGNMTMKTAKKENLNVQKVVIQDDISNASRENGYDRRGLVGGVLSWKIAGGVASTGADLDTVARVTQKFADNVATLAVATSGATHPSTGQPLAELAEDEMEIGMGQHGEGGGNRSKMKTAHETAEIMVNRLIDDLSLKAGEQVLLVLNGSGSTTLMELFIVYRSCVQILAEKNITVAANWIDEILTVQEQGGFQMSITRMDDELLHYWNLPCNTPYLKKI